MYTVFFVSFGFMKHFDDLTEASKYAKDSGFECAVIGPGNEVVEKIKVI